MKLNNAEQYFQIKKVNDELTLTVNKLSDLEKIVNKVIKNFYKL